jgi:hypothetical protein
MPSVDGGNDFVAALPNRLGEQLEGAGIIFYYENCHRLLRV